MNKAKTQTQYMHGLGMIKIPGAVQDMYVSPEDVPALNKSLSASLRARVVTRGREISEQARVERAGKPEEQRSMQLVRGGGLA